ncbi:MAG: hypothetical protein PUK73_00680 [Spirochaetota bacterium]|nr:hypothetical protein [Spirochaetota bacterium]
MAVNIPNVGIKFSDAYIEKTRKLYEPLVGHALSDEECREIAYNMVQLELYLRSLSQKYEED